MKDEEISQGLNRRVSVVLLASMLTMAVILCVIGYYTFRTTYIRFYSEKAKIMIGFLADRTDWEKLEHYAETGEIDEYAQEQIDIYNSMKANAASNIYIYLFIPGEHSLTYLLEATVPGDDPTKISHWGDTFDYTEFEYKYLVPDVEARRGREEITYMRSEVGEGLSTWLPVFDKSGELRAMVELDYILPVFNEDLNAQVAQIAIAFILLIIVALALIMGFMKRSIIQPIEKLDTEVAAYEHGRFVPDASLTGKKDEIRHLALTFSDMTERVETYNREICRVTEEKGRIDAELNLAAKIQMDMLPNTFPAFPERTEFDIYATMNPAKEVGGDFYDFFMIGEDRLAMVVADVSGKGVAAALFSMISKTMLKTQALTKTDPAQVLTEVNALLSENNKESMFVTVWLGILDISTGELTCADAGHEKLLLYQDGAWSYLPKKGGMALAVLDPEDLELMEGTELFHNQTVQLKPGDAVFQYTDGVTEAKDASDVLFGEDRLLAAMESAPSAEPTKLLPHVRTQIDAFVKDAPQFDDITMLGLWYKGAGE